MRQARRQVRPQVQARNTVAIGMANDLVFFKHYVEYHIIVVGVCFVPVGQPLRTAQVHLYIACPKGTPNANTCIQKVGASIVVVLPGNKHFNRIACGGL